ncbi:uncharacterized protein LOC114751173 [Neltuma alba]|uniref:uncharacterized protein LOC114751173 n=1 Tax=Neltuma alba TaxID=207710 RepID=UPI0010A2BB0F|nr:uncharacterized protein LOC114751173 [Prosopis alba]
MAWDFGFRKVVLESDAWALIKKLEMKGMKDRGSLLFVRISEMLKWKWKVRLNYIPRESNNVADAMAKLEASFFKRAPDLTIFFGFTLNIIDTPGLIEGGYINVMALDIIKSFLLNKTIDVLLYVDRLDAYRVDNLDKLVSKAITDSFGKGIWKKAIIALTHGQFSPPDELLYDEFSSRRSEALLKIVKSGARLKKDASQVHCYILVIEFRYLAL